MDKKSKHLMDFISGAIDHLDVSGFEALEILDVRSRLASREPLLDEPDRARLEGAHVLPSHWWWYLDGITSDKSKVAAG